MRPALQIPMLLALSLSGWFCTSTIRGSIIIDGFNAAQHDRFANNPAFIGANFDWSGVGRSSSGAWSTMISDRYFLSASHARPGGTLTFYADNDPTGIPITETVDSGMRIGSTDLYLGLLSNPLPGSIASYAVPGMQIAGSDFLSSGYFLQTIYTVGRSATTTDYGASTATDMAVGRNLIDLYLDEFGGIPGTVTDAFGYIRDPPISPDLPNRFIPDESFLQGGDSGGPSFIADHAGNLLLTGIHWFNGTIEDENQNPLAQVSGDSFVPNYISEINALMTTGAVTQSGFVTAVPEPSELSLAGLMMGLMILGSRWRRKSPVS